MNEDQIPRVLREMQTNFEAALDSSSQRQTPWSRRRGRIVFALACISIVAIALLVGRALLPSKDVTTAEAAAELSRATFSIEAPDQNEFAYTRSEISVAQKVVAGSEMARFAEPGTFARVTQGREAWLSTSRSGLLRVASSTRVGEHAIVASDRGRIRALGNYKIGNETYSPVHLQKLSANPGRAVQDVRRAAAEAPLGERPELLWRLTLEPLQMFAPVLPAPVRAALIRSIATIAGVAVAEGSGSGSSTFSLRTGGLLQSATFDASSAVLTASSTTVLTAGAGPYGDIPAGTSITSFHLLRNGITKRVGEYPR